MSAAGPARLRCSLRAGPLLESSLLNPLSELLSGLPGLLSLSEQGAGESLPRAAGHAADEAAFDLFSILHWQIVKSDRRFRCLTVLPARIFAGDGLVVRAWLFHHACLLWFPNTLLPMKQAEA